MQTEGDGRCVLFAMWGLPPLQTENLAYAGRIYPAGLASALILGPTAAEMDPIAALNMIREVFEFLKDAHEKFTKNKSTAREILRRLFVFEPLIDQIQSQCDKGRLADDADQTALASALELLCRAVCDAKGWINKNLQPEAGGLLTWAKGLWNRDDNKAELERIAVRIDSAVGDLALFDARASTQTPARQTLTPEKRFNPKPQDPKTLNPKPRKMRVVHLGRSTSGWGGGGSHLGFRIS